MEVLIVIGIICFVIWIRINTCPHGIYNGNNCKACAEEKERIQLKLREQERQREEIIRQAEEKRQEEARKLKEGIERHKKMWLEETRKLEFLLQLEPQRFQELIWVLFRKIGWEVKETPFSQDGGSDGLLINGTTQMVLQCKRYRNDISVPTIRDLYGTYSHLKADGAILVTTGRISDPAKKFAKNKNIEMYDGEKLLSLIEQANLTTDLIPDHFVVKHDELLPLYQGKVRKMKNQAKKVEKEIEKENCPDCGIGKLEVRQGYRGLFMGCSRYPKCHFTTEYRSKLKKAQLVKQSVTATKDKLSHWDFFCKAYTTLRRPEDIAKGYKGLHATDSGFNDAFLRYYNITLDVLTSITQTWQSDGRIKIVPAKGGVTLYMIEDAPAMSPNLTNGSSSVANAKISITCPQCSAKLNIANSDRSKKIKCPGCSDVFRI